MFTLRCTQRLLKRLNVAPSDVAAEPTTRLGDWAANLIHLGRLQLVLAVNERTLLPVLVAAAPSATLVPRLRVGVRQVLGSLGVDRAHVEEEDAEMEHAIVSKTANRQVTGVMVDFAFLLEHWVDSDESPLDLSLRLAGTPCSPLYKSTVFPDKAALALFAAEAPRVVH